MPEDKEIAFHRASMKCYQDDLEKRAVGVFYIESSDSHSDILELVADLSLQGIHKIAMLFQLLFMKLLQA